MMFCLICTGFLRSKYVFNKYKFMNIKRCLSYATLPINNNYNENQYLFDIVNKLGLPSNTNYVTLLNNASNINIKPVNLINYFPYCVKNLNEKLDYLPTEELHYLAFFLTHNCGKTIRFSDVFTSFCCRLDKILSRKLHVYGIDQIPDFNLSDILFKTELTLFPWFTRGLIMSFLQLDKSSDLKRFLIIMYLINVSRRKLNNTLQDYSQKHFMNFLPLMTIDHIAVFCSSFFKSQTNFTNSDLVHNIILYLNKNLSPEAHNIAISSIVKALSYKPIKFFPNEIKQLVAKAVKNCPELSLENFNHFSTLTINHKTYCPDFIDLSLTMLENCIDTIRIKDAERIIKNCVYFEHSMHPHYRIKNISLKFEERAFRDKEKTSSFVSLLLNFIIFEIYPKQMLKIFFSKDFLMTACSNISESNLHLHLSLISSAISIELASEYEKELSLLNYIISKSKLPPLTYYTINELKSTDQENIQSKNTALLIKCYKALKKIYGDQCISKNVIPGIYFPEILILSKEFNLDNLNTNKLNCFQNCYVFVIRFSSHFADSFCEHYIGFQRLRVRLLKKLGLKCIDIPFFEISHLNLEDLTNYFMSHKIPIKE